MRTSLVLLIAQGVLMGSLVGSMYRIQDGAFWFYALANGALFAGYGLAIVREKSKKGK